MRCALKYIQRRHSKNASALLKIVPCLPGPGPAHRGVAYFGFGMTGPEVVSEDTLEGLRSLLGVVDGKGEGDRTIWRVRVTRLFPHACEGRRQSVATGL